MMTLHDLEKLIRMDPAHGMVTLMDFVDDFRYYKDPAVLKHTFHTGDERWDALIASTVDYLCRELKITAPSWLSSVPACKDPWFVSGMEDLKAIALVESPLPFRLRKIFVLENFLSRV
jgi:hypothetical protein